LILVLGDEARHTVKGGGFFVLFFSLIVNWAYFFCSNLEFYVLLQYMKKIIPFLTAGMMFVAFTACKEKKEVSHDNIILPKVPREVVDTTLGEMPVIESTNDVKWGGDYKVYVHREPIDSMALVKLSNGRKYKENKIKIRVTRADGSVFFDKSFTKNAFASYLDEAYKAKSTLLGLVYYNHDANHLYFAGSVGSPDMMSDDFVPFKVSVNRMGEVNISKETVIDVTSEQDSLKNENDSAAVKK